MNKQLIIDMIASLSDANGVSGFEDETVTVLREYCGGIGSMDEDAIRNLYVRRNENTGGRPVLQLDAHTDEVGFMVRAVKPNGTLMIVPIGGWAPYCIPAHKFRVRTLNGNYVNGVTSGKPPHFLKDGEKNTVPSIDEIVLDVGAVSSRDAAENFGVYIGAPVVPDVSCFYDEQHGLLHGKAFDCRLGCAAMTETLLELKGKALNVDVVGAFSSQEETGLRGAQVSSATVKPDIAVVFEGCPADDVFEKDFLIQAGIKRGPMLRHFDSKMITNPRFQRFALDVAREYNIPVQEGVRTSGATNSGIIHLHAPAVPVIVIGIPIRYIHTHNGIAAYSDFENAVKLASALIEHLSAAVIKGF